MFFWGYRFKGKTPDSKSVYGGSIPSALAYEALIAKQVKAADCKSVIVGSSPIEGFEKFTCVAQQAEVARLERVECRFKSGRRYFDGCSLKG